MAEPPVRLKRPAQGVCWRSHHCMPAKVLVGAEPNVSTEPEGTFGGAGLRQHSVASVRCDTLPSPWSGCLEIEKHNKHPRQSTLVVQRNILRKMLTGVEIHPLEFCSDPKSGTAAC